MEYYSFVQNLLEFWNYCRLYMWYFVFFFLMYLSLSCQGFWNYCVLGNFQTVKVLNAGPDSLTRHEDEIKKDCISMCSAGNYSTLAFSKNKRVHTLYNKT